MIDIPDTSIEVDLSDMNLAIVRKEGDYVTLVFHQVKDLPIYEARIKVSRAQWDRAVREQVKANFLNAWGLDR